MALSSGFQSVLPGVTSFALALNFTLPLQIICVPSWPTVCFVPAADKGSTVTVRFTDPSPPGGTHGFDFAVTDSGL